MRLIKCFIRFIIDDIKADFKFLGKLLRQEPLEIKYNKKILDVGPAFKEYWYIFLLFIAFFCLGWYLAGIHYETVCYNQLMSYECINRTQSIAYELPNISYSLS